MNQAEYLEILELTTGITKNDLESIIRPIFESQGHDAAKRELKRISEQPLAETDVIVKTYF